MFSKIKEHKWETHSKSKFNKWKTGFKVHASNMNADNGSGANRLGPSRNSGLDINLVTILCKMKLRFPFYAMNDVLYVNPTVNIISGILMSGPHGPHEFCKVHQNGPYSPYEPRVRDISPHE